jgi:hypothetical protein
MDYQKLWKYKYSEHFEHPCEVFIASLYELIFSKMCVPERYFMKKHWSCYTQ